MVVCFDPERTPEGILRVVGKGVDTDGKPLGWNNLQPTYLPTLPPYVGVR